MSFPENTHKLFTFLDCVPFVNTVTNIGYLLFQRAHKVDASVNPVKGGIKTDLKIHALAKDKKDCLIDMIPFVSIVHVGLKVYREGGRVPSLETNILENNKIDAFKLYLNRSPPGKDALKNLFSRTFMKSNAEMCRALLPYLFKQEEGPLKEILHSLSYPLMEFKSEKEREEIFKDKEDIFIELWNHLSLTSINQDWVAMLIETTSKFGMLRATERIIDSLLSKQVKLSYSSVAMILRRCSYQEILFMKPSGPNYERKVTEFKEMPLSLRLKIMQLCPNYTQFDIANYRSHLPKYKEAKEHFSAEKFDQIHNENMAFMEQHKSHKS